MVDIVALQKAHPVSEFLLADRYMAQYDALSVPYVDRVHLIGRCSDFSYG
jgi:hypothetical protein